MSDGTKIEWTDATWNPITGCSVVSPGCTNCYAMRLAGTRLQHHPSRAGLTDASKAGPVWNGQVRLNEQWLDQALRWRKPRRIFVCAHGDLFHENVPDEWIDRVFAVMALCPHHAFQVLTKRSAIMKRYFSGSEAKIFDRIESHGARILEWPLPNVWLGVSVEDQARANERIQDLLATPAAVRFVSAEPLLGPVDFTPWMYDVAGNTAGPWIDPLGRKVPSKGGSSVGGWMMSSRPANLLHWVIVGGESGQNARPMEADWARSIRDQCADAGVAFFMKQMARKAAIPADLMIREFPT